MTKHEDRVNEQVMLGTIIKNRFEDIKCYSNNVDVRFSDMLYVNKHSTIIVLSSAPWTSFLRPHLCCDQTLLTTILGRAKGNSFITSSEAGDLGLKALTDWKESTLKGYYCFNIENLQKLWLSVYDIELLQRFETV